MAEGPLPGTGDALAGRLLRWLGRHWLLWVVIVAVLALAFSRRNAIRALFATLREGAWQWILAAVGLQVLFFLLYALGYQQAFATVQIKSRVRDLLPVVFAAIFVSTASPTAGLTGAALYIGVVTRHGQPAVRAAEGLLLETVIENIALVPVLLIGLSYLLFSQALAAYESLATLLYLAYTAALGVLLFLARWYPRLLRRALLWLQRVVSRIAQRLGRAGLLGPGWGERNAAELQAAADAIARNPVQVGRTMAVALVRQGVNLATLYALFSAFHHPAGLGVIAAGYAVGLVFAVISILPYEIGVFQGIMGLVYASLGVPVPVAIAVVIAFGGIKSWLPIAIGSLIIGRVRALIDRDGDGPGRDAKGT